MHSPRILLALALLSTGMALCRADDLGAGISNDTGCDVTLIENGGRRIRYLGGLHPTLEIATTMLSKYLASTRSQSFWKGDYKLTLFNGEISDAEAQAIFDAALDTLKHFQFNKPGFDMMDGGGVSLEVSNLAGNSMRVTISPLADDKDASPGIARILAIANSYSFKDWEWEKKLPAQLDAGIPSRNRNIKAAALHSLFPDGKTPFTVKRLLAILGSPDRFSKQFGLEKSTGTTETGNGGGTLLFLQADGNEIRAWTPDFKRVLFIGRSGIKPGDEDVLYWAHY